MVIDHAEKLFYAPTCDVKPDDLVAKDKVSGLFINDNTLGNEFSCIRP